MPNKADRLKLKAKGLCQCCGARRSLPGIIRCEECKEVSRRFLKKAVRTKPLYWARQKAERCRSRVKKHNATHPDHPLLEIALTGPELLNHILSLGPTCGLCGVHTGYPWEHVGDSEKGPEVDHILSMWASIGEGRRDWVSLTNVRLLCSDCHREEGARLKRQDLEFRSNMDHMLGKDRT